MTSTERPWWIDDAITTLSEDSLGRAEFAKRVADLITLLAGDQSSTVVGLIGAWGSGKSTTIHFIVQHLQGSAVRVSEFNPWALTGAEAVVAELLSSIRAALPDDATTQTARERLRTYSGYAAPLLSLLPFVGGPASELAKMVAGGARGMTVHDQMKAVAEALQELKQPLLIVIDDVDRLQPDELLALFKAVRVLGRLPYVHYLLSYDEQTVLDVLVQTAIGARDAGRALAFLEKIVTLRLDQPPTRPEQSAKLFGDGLRSALAAASAVLSEDMQRRLADEQGGLFAHTLREPRAIHRFHAQLRAYLPLVGPDEIDVVDFAVLTFLRVAHPRIYQELQTDQRLLSSGPDDLDDEPRLERWVNGTVLENLSVHRSEQPRLQAALRRLFPRIDPEEGHAVIANAGLRRADRRASSRDHVARYFALVPPHDDIRDADLLAALQSCSQGRPHEVSDRIAQALRPQPANVSECELAARLLRRAETYSERFDAAGSAALLTFALGLLPLPGYQAGGESPEAALTDWAARLLGQTEGLDTQQLLSALERPADQGTPLLPVLRALSVAVEERRLQPRTGTETTPWLDALADALAAAAWDRFVTNVRAGDDAANEPTGGLLSWLDNYLGEPEVNRRLATVLDQGLPIADLAARLVTIGLHTATGKQTILGFDAARAVKRVGLERATKDPQITAAQPGGAADEDDVTWHNRRKVATVEISRHLAEGLSVQAVGAPPPARPTAGPLLNHRPSLIDAPEEPELSIRMTVLMPPGALPQTGSVVPGLSAAAREEAVERLIQEGPLTLWMQRVAPRWHAQMSAWTVKDTDPRTRTRIQAELTVADDTATSWRQQRPVIVGAQVVTGVAAPGPGEAQSAVLVMSVQVGLWLVELNAKRRPSDRRNSSEPLPAALTLAEVHELLVALCSTVRSAQRAAVDLLDDGLSGSDLLVDLSIDTSLKLPALVDVQSFTRMPTSGGSQVRQSFDVTTVALAVERSGLAPQPQQLATSLLNEWLLASGLRGYEAALAELTGPVSL